MTPWISQQRNHLDHLEERARPAMCEKNGQRFRSLTALMNEMDTKTINISAKLRKLIEPCLLCSPIELILPVRHQGLEIL